MGASPKGGAGALEDKRAVAPTLDGTSFDSGASGASHIVVRAPHIGRFAIIREIGAGGMGSVFAAYDEQLDRKVALKILNKGDRGGQQLLTLREARAAARISHPNVISVYEVGEANGHIHIAMEYVDGGTLLTWQGQGGRHWREILTMYGQAGGALLAAHEADVVHRALLRSSFPARYQLLDRTKERAGKRRRYVAMLRGELGFFLLNRRAPLYHPAVPRFR
jgi:hypothetical protein